MDSFLQVLWAELCMYLPSRPCVQTRGPSHSTRFYLSRTWGQVVRFYQCNVCGLFMTYQRSCARYEGCTWYSYRVTPYLLVSKLLSLLYVHSVLCNCREKAGVKVLSMGRCLWFKGASSNKYVCPLSKSVKLLMCLSGPRLYSFRIPGVSSAYILKLGFS